MGLRLVLITSALTVLVSCGDEVKTVAIEDPNLPIDVTRLYNLHCLDCHGDDGKLGLGGANDLSTSTLSLDARIDVITNGSVNGKMRPFGIENYGDLTDREIEELAKHIEILRK